jgi:hypothetical protein
MRHAEGEHDPAVPGRDPGRLEDPADQRDEQQTGRQSQSHSSQRAGGVSRAAHCGGVRAAVEMMQYRRRRQEQVALVEGVRHQVEDGDPVQTETAEQEHQPELGGGRGCQHALDFGLHVADELPVQRRRRSDDADRDQRRRRVVVNRRRTHNQVDTGRHHRRGMN